jgi:hypothetical protein
MTDFKSLVMAKHPRDRVWSATRDARPSVVPYLDDIERIVVESRTEGADGTISIVNQWRAKAKIPPALAAVIKPEMLAWTDHAVWDPREHACRFRIETRFFPDRVRCSGTTSYEVAMGGRGTRVSFSGKIQVIAKGLPGVPAFLEETVSSGIEAFVAALIPGNLRKVVDGVAAYLTAELPASQP